MAEGDLQRELSGSRFKSVTESQVVKSGEGVLRKIVVANTNTGTLKVIDGLEAGANAVGTLTSTGACAPAVYGTSTLTSDATNVAEDETVTIAAVVYTFKDAVTTVANTVKVGANAAASLDNLKHAINGTGTGGTHYGSLTVAHPQFIATTNTDTTQIIRSRTIGNAAATAVINAYVTEETSDHLAWTGADIANGVAAAVTTDAATTTIGTTVYTAVTGLAETYGLTAAAYQVLWVTNEATFLDNLKQAINGSGIAGTDYSTGTLPHTLVVATTNAADSQVVQYKDVGTAGNAVATTETMANYAWGAATLASGTGSTGTVILETTTPAKDVTLDFGNCEFETGLSIVVGGTSLSLGVYYK
ncbi:MAG: hypothetical protein GY861_18285 [bacterium]|nr:hypothetical protein [bacterium]